MPRLARPVDVTPSRTARFWPKVKKAEGCWEWAAFVNPAGYGVFYLGEANPRWALAHRYAHAATHGPHDPTLELDHLCRNRKCVRPDHLEPVSHRVNVMRSPVALAARQARQTHCKRGHEFTPENTYQPPGRFQRMCRECYRLIYRPKSRPKWNARRREIHGWRERPPAA